MWWRINKRVNRALRPFRTSPSNLLRDRGTEEPENRGTGEMERFGNVKRQKGTSD